MSKWQIDCRQALKWMAAAPVVDIVRDQRWGRINVTEIHA